MGHVELAGRDGADLLTVSVVAAAPAAPVPGDEAPAVSLTLRLPPGATVADALRASGLVERLGAGVFDALSPSVWGRACALDLRLRTGDRIELTRPLTVDPKEARRLRYQRDGVRRKTREPRRQAAREGDASA